MNHTSLALCVRCGGGPIKARGVCGDCYRDLYKQGLLDVHALPAKNSPEFWTARAVHLEGETKLDSQGYVREWRDGKHVPQHRLVMEAMLGRPLARGENVHHRNGVRHDNRPENLELWAHMQPYGQRVSELLDYVVEHHAEEMRARLAAHEVANLGATA